MLVAACVQVELCEVVDVGIVGGDELLAVFFEVKYFLDKIEVFCLVICHRNGIVFIIEGMLIVFVFPNSG